jgi:hypothetical protein
VLPKLAEDSTKPVFDSALAWVLTPAPREKGVPQNTAGRFRCQSLRFASAHSQKSKRQALHRDPNSVIPTVDFISLPSAQGWTYFSSGAAESDVFSLTEGVLSMNATLTNAAYYTMGNIVDPLLPFDLTATARVFSGGQALAFYVLGAGQSAAINIAPTRIIDEATRIAAVSVPVLRKSRRSRFNSRCLYPLHSDCSAPHSADSCYVAVRPENCWT